MNTKATADTKKLPVNWAREVRFDLPVAVFSSAERPLPVEVVEMSFDETASPVSDALGAEISGCRTAPGKIEVRLREVPSSPDAL